MSSKHQQSTASVRWRQIKLLLRKNYLLNKRNIKGTALMLLVPFVFVFFLWILKFGLDANEKRNDVLKPFPSPVPQTIGDIPRCIIGDERDSCYTVNYVSDTSIGDWVIDRIAQQFTIPSEEIRKFSTVDEMDSFLFENKNSTTAAVVFSFNSTSNELHYSLKHNDTQIYVEGQEVRMAKYLQLPWVYQIEKLLAINLTNNPNLNYNIDYAEFAHPELVVADVIQDLGGLFFFASLMFNVVIQLGQIVKEKELKLREGMNMMGLKDSVYWFTWLVTNCAFNIVSSLVLTASGYIFQFDFFKKNDFGTFFFLFLLFSLSMVTFVFFLSTLIKSSDIATSIGFVIFLIGIVIQGVASFAFQEDFFVAVRVILSLLPFALLTKGINDLSEASAGSVAVGLRWSERTSNAWFSLQDVYGWFIIDFFVFLIVALYLDNVIQSEYGVSKPLYFFLQPSYWKSSPPKISANSETHQPTSKAKKNGLIGKDEIEMEGGEMEDEEVVNERNNIINNTVSEDTAVKIVNLRKVYTTKSCCKVKSAYAAVKGTYLTIGNGQLFVLLGHNGSGKSTTFGMCTGLFSPTSGDAFIFGNSILTQMTDIRQSLGICPQHDILFDELTGREHLEIYAAFKGIPEDEIEQEVITRLKEVDLLHVQNLVSSKYSGGMRRRLSTAIAFIADPKIVFLDEPTTGMDSIAKRAIWGLIERAKRGRVIILTTHSMEEADCLGDRIGIMKKGRLITLGTSLRLKNKFGTGYKIVALVDEKNQSASAEVQQFFQQELQVQPSSMAVGVLEFNIPREKLPVLKDFFRKVEDQRSHLPIKDIQISLSTLEEVFMTISGHEE
ncbi:ABC transporter A family protein [Tieghemostelium lacteum]|uniref:ABC transporter A family protein n=1 Tax=Tieghemostelium lacteum TaxID=361077 RepID=A0A151Z5C8_TIELA|nr:ABC transporter A family protein [Tieghemostelium lacteum]|eukprot:KYQ89172.1 ABC transporter A family protein [Tieghemostelium lacteum]